MFVMLRARDAAILMPGMAAAFARSAMLSNICSMKIDLSSTTAVSGIAGDVKGVAVVSGTTHVIIDH